MIEKETFYSEINLFGKIKFSREFKIDPLNFSDDIWDREDAQVACRMLGFNPEYAENTTKSRFGNVEDNFIMDNVACKGTEDSLEDCRYRGIDDCKGTEAAGVICHGKERLEKISGIVPLFFL